MITKEQRFKGCLLGLAVGDAVGTTNEFKTRGSFTPITDMVGGGAFKLNPGEWTDDTSMALCLADSLLAANGFDAVLTMELWCAWRYDGYLSSTGRCFDVGGVTSSALARYTQTRNPWQGLPRPDQAGNGCLMRLAPVVMFYFPFGRGSAIRWASESSRLTHGAVECLIASQLFADLLWLALSGASKYDIATCRGGFNFDLEASPRITGIAEGHYRSKNIQDIKGTGYVVDSLEAALYCFHKTDNYWDAILMAANLGDDADTTAAICGQLAGAFYGVEGIPAKWRKRVKWGEKIEKVAVMLMNSRK